MNNLIPLTIMGDVVQVVVVVGTIAGGLEILSGEVLQGLLVEHILKMLKLFSLVSY